MYLTMDTTKQFVRPTVGRVIEWLITEDTPNNQGVNYYGSVQILQYLRELPYTDISFKNAMRAYVPEHMELLTVTFQFDGNNLPFPGYVKCKFIQRGLGNEISSKCFVGRYSTQVFMDLLIKVHALSHDDSEPFDYEHQALSTLPAWSDIDIENNDEDDYECDRIRRAQIQREQGILNSRIQNAAVSRMQHLHEY